MTWLRALRLHGFVVRAVSFGLLLVGLTPHELRAAGDRGQASLGLTLEGARDGDESARLEQAIENELGVVTSSELGREFPVGNLHIVLGATEASIVYQASPESVPLERRVTLPGVGVRRAQVVAWLAGNVVRNEASALLARWATPPPLADVVSTEQEEVERPSVAPKSPASPAVPRAATPSLRAGRVELASTRTESLGTSFVHAALLSPWLSTDPEAHRARVRLELDGVYGHVGAVDGLGVGVMMTQRSHPSSGVQLTGLGVISGPFRGFSLTGGGLYGRGELVGAEIAGLGLVRAGSVEGLQLSFGANLVDGSVTGAQLTSGVNWARVLCGVQFGAVNVSTRVKGLQLGLVNVKSDADGFAVGLFNWSKDARLHPLVFVQTPAFVNLGYRVVSAGSTGSISLGYDEARKQARTHFGLGSEHGFGTVALGLEFGYGWVLEHLDRGATDRAHELDLIGRASVEFLPELLNLYAGAGGRLPVSGVVPVELHPVFQAGLAFL